MLLNSIISMVPHHQLILTCIKALRLNLEINLSMLMDVFNSQGSIMKKSYQWLQDRWMLLQIWNPWDYLKIDLMLHQWKVNIMLPTMNGWDCLTRDTRNKFKWDNKGRTFLLLITLPILILPRLMTLIILRLNLLTVIQRGLPTAKDLMVLHIQTCPRTDMALKNNLESQVSASAWILNRLLLLITFLVAA